MEGKKSKRDEKEWVRKSVKAREREVGRGESGKERRKAKDKRGMHNKLRGNGRERDE